MTKSGRRRCHTYGVSLCGASLGGISAVISTRPTLAKNGCGQVKVICVGVADTRSGSAVPEAAIALPYGSNATATNEILWSGAKPTFSTRAVMRGTVLVSEIC